jgi:peptidoglycan/LPS O-acetylase OafA/YrhL
MRIPALDGLRAASILLVLAAHLLPLGAGGLLLNKAAGLMGMAIFFSLSGFLIVQFLATGMPISVFVVRRLARIVPLAWTAMLLLYFGFGGEILVNLAFLANIPPIRLMEGGDHLWSLCLEVQFYAFAALLAVISRRALYAVPVICLIITGVRIFSEVPYSIVTWYRVDEILAGGVVALIYIGWFGEFVQNIFRRASFSLAVVFLAISCIVEPLQYIRPYMAACVLASAIFNVNRREAFILESRPARYIAEISYALYVVHGALVPTWLGAGDTLVKYIKRPLFFAVTFFIAHISTYYFERPITQFARRVEKGAVG